MTQVVRPGRAPASTGPAAPGAITPDRVPRRPGRRLARARWRRIA